MDITLILQLVSTISAFITPIFLAILSYFLATFNAKQEKRLEMQAGLQDERIAIYNQVLEPYIVVATPEELLHKQAKYKGKTSGQAAGEIIATPQYKMAEFKLFLIGSDGVVSAYSEMKQFLLSGKLDGSIDTTKENLQLSAKFLLKIRKSVGYEDTQISNRQAIDWFVKDAEKYF